MNKVKISTICLCLIIIGTHSLPMTGGNDDNEQGELDQGKHSSIPEKAETVYKTVNGNEIHEEEEQGENCLMKFELNGTYTFVDNKHELESNATYVNCSDIFLGARRMSKQAQHSLAG